MPTPEEVRERVAGLLQHAFEVARTASRVGLVVLATLIVIWFTQVRSQYEDLVRVGYPERKNSYVAESDALAKIRTTGAAD